MKKYILLLILLCETSCATFHQDEDFGKKHKATSIDKLVKKHLSYEREGDQWFSITLSNGGHLQISWRNGKTVIKLTVMHQAVSPKLGIPKGVDYYGNSTIGFIPIKDPKVNFSISQKTRRKFEGMLNKNRGFQVSYVQRKNNKTKSPYSSTMELEASTNTAEEVVALVQLYVKSTAKDATLTIDSGLF